MQQTEEEEEEDEEEGEEEEEEEEEGEKEKKGAETAWYSRLLFRLNEKPQKKKERENVRGKYLKRGNIPRGARTRSHEE